MTSTYDFDDQLPADYLDGLLATAIKVTEAFKPGGMPKEMVDLAWAILLEEFRDLRREQQAYRKAFTPPPKNGGARTEDRSPDSAGKKDAAPRH